ncbi:hypothetical protein KS4_19380 [Poriferisphaera corsica]|uniref:Uncharacterized protein n=1 Tax=Poriferisphaera corsica TaxID=2528020 RepID=A0A517YUG5_9BACT|nr:hypothetical protein [Poriferisphaera corsica]QDU33879.1 hypothetical protein KS4_19380 [Poriferisphaera corsica]
MTAPKTNPKQKPLFNIKAIRFTFVFCLLFIALAIPLSYVIIPKYAHHKYANLLTATEYAQRKQAHAYIIKSVKKSPSSLSTFPLSKLTDSQFLELYAALNTAYLWDPDTLPPNIYLRWLRIQLKSSEPNSQIFALELISQSDNANNFNQLLPDILTLVASNDVNTQYATLMTLSRFYTQTSELSARSIENAVAKLTQSPHLQTARHAWITLALLPQLNANAEYLLDDHPTINTHSDPHVIEAAIWAISQSGSNLDQLLEYAYTPETQIHTIFPLNKFLYKPQALNLLTVIASTPNLQITPKNQVAVWRAVLSLPKPDFMNNPSTLYALANAEHAQDPGNNQLLQPLTAAATYKAGIAVTRSRPFSDPFGALIRLATVEGQTHPYMIWTVTENTPPLLQVITQRYNASPTPAAFLPALTSDTPPQHALASHIASQTLTDKQIALLISKLKQNSSPHAPQAIALLHAFTGLAPSDLINQYIQNDDNYTLSKTAEIARWLQTPNAPLSTDPNFLLLSNHYPRSTILALLLHAPKHFKQIALDYLLLNPQTTNADLLELLDSYRFYYILYDNLPSSAPPLWLWADPQLQNLQLDTLHSWYLLSRHKITDKTAPSNDS